MSDQNETGQHNTGNGDGSAWSVFESIRHPVLKSVDPVKVSSFLRARERYENEVAEKKKEMPSLSKASYKFSADQGLLRIMHFPGELESVAPGKELAQLTATGIEKRVKTLVVREDSSSRWWHGYRGKRLVVKRVTHLLLEQDIVEIELCKESEWPKPGEIDRAINKAEQDIVEIALCKESEWPKPGEIDRASNKAEQDIVECPLCKESEWPKPGEIDRAINKAEQDIVECLLCKEFEWPSIEMIHRSQSAYQKDAGFNYKVDDDELVRIKGKLWIPESDAELQQKIWVVGHCGPAGHRAKESTCSIIKENYIWKTMEMDCKEFVRSCLHCLTGKTGHRIPRPLSTTVHGTRPNEVIHVDFLYMGPGVEEHKYILVIRDDLSSYLWLCPAQAATAEVAATELARWIRTFTIMEMWVSDQGSHFKNEVMKELAEEHRIKHNFTVAYSPWVNGTVESCMKTVQAAYRCLKSELKLGPQDWPTVIGMIMTALNEAPLKRLGSREDGTFRTPLEVMTGIKPARAMLHSTAIGKSNAKVRNLEKIRAMQILDIAGLQKQFDGLHKDVAERVTENRAKNIKSHNKKTNLVVPKFEKGDFVLVRRAQDKGHKQSYRWVGPRRITKVVSELIYEVEHMLTQKVEKVHAARLQLYRAGMDGAKVSKELLSHTECSEAKYEIVDEVIDVAGNEKEGIFVQVKWLGLPDRKDWTWHPIKDIHEDIPDKVEEFLRTTKKKRAGKQAREQIGLSL